MGTSDFTQCLKKRVFCCITNPRKGMTIAWIISLVSTIIFVIPSLSCRNICLRIHVTSPFNFLSKCLTVGASFYCFYYRLHCRCSNGKDRANCSCRQLLCDLDCAAPHSHLHSRHCHHAKGMSLSLSLSLSALLFSSLLFSSLLIVFSLSFVFLPVFFFSWRLMCHSPIRLSLSVCPYPFVPTCLYLHPGCVDPGLVLSC